MKGRTQSEHGASQHTPLRHSIGPQGKRQGGRQHADGGHRTQDGEASSTAALQSSCHPPPTMPPHHPQRPHPPPRRGGGAGKGYPTTRTAQTHTHHPHATHPARNSTQHDSSTRQHCNGMSRARTTPPHRAGQQQHTPPPFHTPRRMDTIHSSTHLLSLIHVHTTDDQR